MESYLLILRMLILKTKFQGGKNWGRDYQWQTKPRFAPDSFRSQVQNASEFIEKDIYSLELFVGCANIILRALFHQYPFFGLIC